MNDAPALLISPKRAKAITKLDADFFTKLISSSNKKITSAMAKEEDTCTIGFNKKGVHVTESHLDNSPVFQRYIEKLRLEGITSKISVKNNKVILKFYW